MSHASSSNNRSTADLLLEALKEVGIDYLFSNLGTDHAPLIEALAERKLRGNQSPKIILCPHESTAAHMAGGYALVTGRGQGILVHVDVGTANAAIGMHNLFRSRIPAFLMAGKAPFTTHGEALGSRDNYVHFVQEPFDQASLVRPYVKWEWTLPSGVVAQQAIRRAHTIMQSEPKGPVYMMLPRETLGMELASDEIPSFSEENYGYVPPSGCDPNLVETLVKALMKARYPIILTSYAGRTEGASEAIDRVARFAGIRVIESNMVNNISHESDCFSGFQAGPHLEQADFVLMVDTDVPWIPRDVKWREDVFRAQIDLDVLKVNSPLWSFPNQLRLQGNSARILQQLLLAVQSQSTPSFEEGAKKRLSEISQERVKRVARSAEIAASPGEVDAINPHYLCRMLGQRIQPEDFIMHEAARNAPALLQQIPRPIPGSLVRVAGGGLGASGGMALGVKLARPQHLSLQILGDGSFYLNNPSSTFAVSKKYELPIFTIILDNGGWSAVKESTLRMYPDGQAKAMDAFEAELAQGVDFSKMIEGFGGYGELLTRPDRIEAALDRCLEALRSGRAALLHVKVKRL